MNRRIANLLTRFGVDGQKMLAEAAHSPPDARTLLRHPALVDDRGLIRLYSIGVMDAMLEIASNGKPAITPPKNPKVALQAISLFLRLNHTQEFGWREKDTPQAWSTRIIDVLFMGLAQKKVFSHSDFLALERISRNPIWQGLFSYALGLFLVAIADPKRIAMLDRATSSAAVQAFRASSAARQARLPKVKYGNPMAGFKDIAEYAIGEYLEGLDVNEALARTLVQAQLGLNAGDGQERFEAFLRDNHISPDTFPTTIGMLYEAVDREVRFKESEGEVAAVCYSYAAEQKETAKIEKIFSCFADAVFPVAAKCRRQFAFGDITASDAAQIIARWARGSRTLVELRSGGLAKQVAQMVPTLGRDERRALIAFRDGRTESGTISAQDIANYSRIRCKMLTLSAQQAKITRVEQLIAGQINGAEQFILRPGQPALQDMTYGVDVFFRALRTVMEDICNGTGAQLRDQTRALADFQRRYGPLPTVALLVPMRPNCSSESWIKEARGALNQVDPDAFS